MSHLTDDQLDRLLGDRPNLGVHEREDILAHVLEKTAPAAPERGWRGLRWALVALAVMVAAVVPVLYSKGGDDAFTARGGGALKPSFSVSCLPAPCAPGAKLAFTVSPGSFTAFSAVAEAPDGTTVWLFPEGVGVSESGVLKQAPVLDGPIGDYVIHGVFSSAPLSRAQVRETLSSPTPDGVAVVVQRVSLK